MQKIKAVTEYNTNDFEIVVQSYLDKGYKVSSTYCGLINYTDGSCDSTYKAILLKGED